MKGPSENLQCKNFQSLSVDANPLDLFDQSLLLDMIILGTHQLCGRVNILFLSDPGVPGPIYGSSCLKLTN